MERFSIRPGYGSDRLVVEFLGDHRSSAFPKVGALLAKALDARCLPMTQLAVHRGIAGDELRQTWRYAGGEYELDDDGWFLFILAPENNQSVMADIERALLASGQFTKQAVDFARYR